LVHRPRLYHGNRDLPDWHFLGKPLILHPLDNHDDVHTAGLHL